MSWILGTAIGEVPVLGNGLGWQPGDLCNVCCQQNNYTLSCCPACQIALNHPTPQYWQLNLPTHPPAFTNGAGTCTTFNGIKILGMIGTGGGTYCKWQWGQANPNQYYIELVLNFPTPGTGPAYHYLRFHFVDGSSTDHVYAEYRTANNNAIDCTQPLTLTLFANNSCGVAPATVTITPLAVPRIDCTCNEEFGSMAYADLPATMHYSIHDPDGVICGGVSFDGQTGALPFVPNDPQITGAPYCAGDYRASVTVGGDTLTMQWIPGTYCNPGTIDKCNMALFVGDSMGSGFCSSALADDGCTCNPPHFVYRFHGLGGLHEIAITITA